MYSLVVKTTSILLIWASTVQGLTFYLTGTRERCFHDDYTQNTVVIGTHQLIDKIPETHTNEGVQLTISDPDNVAIVSKYTNNTEGKFTFTTKKAGKYQICMKTSNNLWFDQSNQPKYTFRLKQGEELELFTAAKQSHIGGLQQRIQQLQNAQRDFLKLQEMNRLNEDQLSQENLKINDRVLKATIFQTIVITLAGVYQIYSLRRFFQKKLYY